MAAVLTTITVNDEAVREWQEKRIGMEGRLPRMHKGVGLEGVHIWLMI